MGTVGGSGEVLDPLALLLIDSGKDLLYVAALVRHFAAGVDVGTGYLFKVALIGLHPVSDGTHDQVKADQRDSDRGAERGDDSSDIQKEGMNDVLPDREVVKIGHEVLFEFALYEIVDRMS